MKMFVVRHGESVANVHNVYAGQGNVQLTEKGKKQAEKIRTALEHVRFDKVYSSDLSRAVETQRIVLPDWDGEQTALLREYDVGSLEGQNIIGASQRRSSEFNLHMGYSYFGGEDSSMVQKRVRMFLEKLEKSPCENVAVFSHGGFMLCMLSVILNTAFDRDVVCCQNCCINVFEFDGDKWQLCAWNCLGEL